MAQKINLLESVKKFSGEDDVELWFDRLEIIIELAGLANQDAAKMFPLFIEGAAYATWKQLSEEKKKVFAEIKQEFRRVYGRTKTQAWNEIKHLRYMPGDSIDVLAEKIETLMTTVVSGKTPHREMIAVLLLDKLPGNLAEQIRLHHGETLDLEKVCSCAKSLVSSTSQSLSFDAAAGFMAPNEGPRVNDLHSKEKVPGLRCFCCRQIGHLRRDCPVRCKICNKRGHHESQCYSQQGNE